MATKFQFNFEVRKINLYTKNNRHPIDRFSKGTLKTRIPFKYKSSFYITSDGKYN